MGVNSVPSAVSACSTHCLPIDFHCHCMQSPDVECVHLTQPFHMWSPLDISDTGASTVDNGRDPMLSQKVYGELVSSVTCEECAVTCHVFSADHSDHLILFRKYVSRKAATKGRAVLEGVGLLTETIDACFSSHPLNEEEAVQAGLTRWSGGQGRQPPTWQVLISAMEYAKIAQQHIEDLRNERVCVCVCCVCKSVYLTGKRLSLLAFQSGRARALGG